MKIQLSFNFAIHVFISSSNVIFSLVLGVKSSSAYTYIDKSLLLPAIKQCILNVDVENGTMQVHVLEGLLDL